MQKTSKCRDIIIFDKHILSLGLPICHSACHSINVACYSHRPSMRRSSGTKRQTTAVIQNKGHGYVLCHVNKTYMTMLLTWFVWHQIVLPSTVQSVALVTLTDYHYLYTLPVTLKFSPRECNQISDLHCVTSTILNKLPTQIIKTSTVFFDR